MDRQSGSIIEAIAETVFKRRQFLLLFTLLSILLGVTVYLLRPKKYTAETLFILKNPLYADRNNLYNNETKFIDYFASEDDIDRMISMAESDVIQEGLIRKMNLARVYDFDTTSPRQYAKLKKKVASYLEVIRTDKKEVVLKYTDKDPRRAAEIANYCVPVLENALRQFYNGMRHNMYTSIMSKIREQDSAIIVLTDTLVRLRQQYGINDIISPSRYNLMLSSFSATSNKEFPRGVEVIQNIESIKDELVGSRARNITLVNQYTTGTSMNELPLANVVRRALPPIKPVGVGLVLVLVSCTFAGLFFGSLYILLSEYYRG